MRYMNLFTFARRLLVVLLVTLTGLVSAQDVLRVSPDNLHEYWQLAIRQIHPSAPNSGLNLYKPGCVAVSYLIGTDGHTHDVRVARVIPRSDLGPYAAQIVSQLVYRSAEGISLVSPIRTYLVVPFNLPLFPARISSVGRVRIQAERRRIIAACQLPGYGGR